MIVALSALLLAANFLPAERFQHSPGSKSTQQEQFIVVHRMNRPDSAIIEGRYRCRDADVRLELTLTGSAVRVTDYSDANGSASSEELSQWNGWLSDIKSYHAFSIACQGGGAVVVYVYEPNPQRLRDAPYVAAFWDAGEVKRLPFTPGPPGQ